MSLHGKSYGSGKPLIMLHGWGMHGGIWGSVVPQLAQNFRVHCVDLPGYGASLGLVQYDLDGVVQSLSSQFAEPVTVCGWSLGGQVALRWAQLHPEQVEKLVLVASTPCFVQRADWRCAMAADVLQEFSNAMTQDYQATLKRFLGLQLRGSENERDLLLRLREQLFSRGEPDGAALRGGLEILRDTDLRMQLGQIGQETLLIAGMRDTLTPPAASEYMAQALPNAHLKTVAGAAHAPFLSHPEIFVEHVVEFMKG
jgi:pimeloyl-[acyl-carrier protein] methyl ester esterase